MSTKALIERNLELVTQNAPDLIARFYATLFMRNPQLAPLFGRRSAEAQQKMLLQAIVAVVDHLEDNAWLDGTLRALGRNHVAYGVTEEMYPMVASAMLDSLREASGDGWDDPTAQAWTGALSFVAETMIAGARDAAVAAE